MLHVSSHENILFAGERSRERIRVRKVVLGFEARRTDNVVGSQANERIWRAAQCFSDLSFCLDDRDPLDQRALDFATIHDWQHHGGPGYHSLLKSSATICAPSPPFKKQYSAFRSRTCLLTRSPGRGHVRCSIFQCQAPIGKNSVQAVNVLKLLGIDGNATLASRESHSRCF